MSHYRGRRLALITIYLALVSDYIRIVPDHELLTIRFLYNNELTAAAPNDSP